MARMTRRRFFFYGAAASLGLATIAYGRLVEPSWLDLTAVDVKLPRRRLARPIRILHLSDLHQSPEVPLSLLQEAIDLGLSTAPDLICVTGDFITSRRFDRKGYPKVLACLSAAAPTFACLGNHDGGAWIASRGYGFSDPSVMLAVLEESGIDCLRNRNRLVRVGDQELFIAGVGDLLSADVDGAAAFAGIPAEDPRPTLLLAHNPDSKALLREPDWDLMLCGHTHGGQVKFPLLGAPWTAILDRQYVAGLNPWRDRLIYTNRGIGSIRGIRINCRPEVTLLSIS